MKKAVILSVVLILLTVTIVPAMADGPSNSHGIQISSNQENSTGTNPEDTNQDRLQDQDRMQTGNGNPNPGTGSNATGGDARMRTPFYLLGTITAIDIAAKSVTISLTHGNAVVRQNIGTDLVVQTNDGTLIVHITQGNEREGTADRAPSSGMRDDGSGEMSMSGEARNGAPTISSSTGIPVSDNPANRGYIVFDQLEIGQTVAIRGNLVDGVYTAILITVQSQVPVGETDINRP
jgi:hypothetical protein